MSIRSARFAPLASLLLLAACGGVEPSESAGDDAALDDGSIDAAYEDGKEDSARSGRFEVFVGSDGGHYFHLLAKNGQKVLRSQSYAGERAAYDGVAAVRANVAEAARVEFRDASDGQAYFVVKAANNAIVAVSELYASRSNADAALASVRTTVKTATGGAPSAGGARFQVFKGIDGKYYFHVRAGNGAILAVSQAYTTRSAAVSGTASVTANAATSSRYEVRDARSGQAYFVLKAANGAVIAKSEIYASRASAGRGRDALVALASSGISSAR